MMGLGLKCTSECVILANSGPVSLNQALQIKPQQNVNLSHTRVFQNDCEPKKKKKKKNIGINVIKIKLFKRNIFCLF